jgi:hypothetical protein
VLILWPFTWGVRKVYSTSLNFFLCETSNIFVANSISPNFFYKNHLNLFIKNNQTSIHSWISYPKLEGYRF